MTRAGHANMKTTQTYLHLAGVVFPGEAKRLEERFGLPMGSPSAEVGTGIGTDLREPHHLT